MTPSSAAPPTSEKASPATAGDELPSLESLDAEQRPLEARSRALSAARLTSFAVMVLGLLGAASAAWVPWAISLPAFLSFFYLVVAHERVHRKLRRIAVRRQTTEEADERLRTRRRERPLPSRSGSDPLERGEAVYAPECATLPLEPGVAGDLDLLTGPRALFGFLDVSSTVFGARRLRSWIEAPLAEPDDIRRRQAFVKELAERPRRLRRVLELFVPLRKRPLQRVPEWLASGGSYLDSPWVGRVASLLGTVPIASIVLGIAFDLRFLFLLVPSVVGNMAFAGSQLKKSNPARDRLVVWGPLLDALFAAEDALESDRFETDAGQALQRALAEARPPLTAFRRRLRWLELHQFGVFFEFLNVITLFELRMLPSVERHLVEHRADLEQSVGALGELEAYLSLALPLVEHRGFRFPEVLDQPEARLSATELAHPLLSSDEAVANSIDLGEGLTGMIVTGSNMAGKSTYLKSVGTNLVLAQMGGPVCAGSFRFTPLTIASDVNVSDSLDDGKSYFQAEVERVREILRVAREKPRVLAIFDELFRGTNSDERWAISASLIRALRDAGALQVVATHDLRLTELVDTDAEPHLANFHFSERVVDSEMTFDYTLREGPARSRNAIRVLEVSGYPAELIEEARRRIAEE